MSMCACFFSPFLGGYEYGALVNNVTSATSVLLNCRNSIGPVKCRDKVQVSSSTRLVSCFDFVYCFAASLHLYLGLRSAAK